MKKTIRLLSLAFILSLVFALSTLGVSASEPSGENAPVSASNSKTISVNFSEVDVRDALSALAVNMGYNIIYTAQPLDITVQMSNVTPKAAFDYVLKMAGLSYYQDGTSLVVGEKAALLEEFSKTLSLTKFDLNYISRDTIIQAIQQLNIDVKTISIKKQTHSFYVQGFPPELAKVSELIRVLDVFENQDYNGDSGSALTLIEFAHISASGFNNLLRQTGYTNGITVAENDRVLWIYADATTRAEILSMREKLDTLAPRMDIGGLETEYFTYDLAHISAAEAVRRLDKLPMAQEVAFYATTLPEFSKTLFVYCDKSYRQQMIAALSALDVEMGKTYNIPVYKATTADEAQQMKVYLQTMLGTEIISDANFLIQTFNGQSILYMIDAKAETVQVAEEMIKRFEVMLSAQISATDLTWTAFEQDTNGGNTLEKNDTNMILYAAWVQSKIK